MGICMSRRQQPAQTEHVLCGVPVEKIHYNNIPEFTFQIQKGYVVKVYDGDTITIAFDYNNHIYRKSVRLSGIDTPEMKSKNPQEREFANKARQFVEDKVMNKWVYLTEISNDKYGRILAKVSVGNLCINDELLRLKLAVPYNGKTKQEFEPTNFE
jgi:endonuclease YncB( thermonuclease family)